MHGSLRQVVISVYGLCLLESESLGVDYAGTPLDDLLVAIEDASVTQWH